MCCARRRPQAALEAGLILVLRCCSLEWAHLGSNQEQPGYEPGALTD
jgi:hypothetical protein